MSWQEFRHWFAEQPFTTKWITVFSLVLPLLMRLQVIGPHWLVWHWESISRRAQVWRMVTALFLTRVNFNFIIALYFRFQYSLYLETGYFAGRPADYTYFVLLTTLLINVVNYFIGMAALWESFSMTIVYVWALNNREVVVNFMFGFRFPALYLPAVLGLLEFLMTGDLWGPLVGILAGHTYYFLSEIYAKRDPRWRTRLQAPSWLRALVPAARSSGSIGGYQGFSVQRPEEAFGGRANAKGPMANEATGAAPPPHESGFKAFGGKGHKLGA